MQGKAVPTSGSRGVEDSMPTREVMLEDSLEDAENLHTEFKNDVVGANYLKMARSVSFSDFCTYTVEVPTSEHWRREVKSAKQN